MTTEEQFLEPCFADYEEGDRACFRNPQNNLVLGTVLRASEDQLVMQLDRGEAIVVTKEGDKKQWASVFEQWHKLPDLSQISSGSILSKIISINFDRCDRVYAVVSSILHHKRAVLLDSNDDFVILEAGPANAYSLEAAFLGWELEE